jgi:DMSO/TMAO reductase YedYZ heme-binding membrane subunit
LKTVGDMRVRLRLEKLALLAVEFSIAHVIVMTVLENKCNGKLKRLDILFIVYFNVKLCS